MKECCGTCQDGSYDEMQGYVCVNGNSEYVADFVDSEHWCENFTERRQEND